MKIEDITIEVASEKHLGYVERILTSIEEAAQVRGTGIARRKPEYIARKIEEAKAVIALHGEDFAGFSYIETWEHKRYVTTSGLIVHPDYQGRNIAKRIKDHTFTLARVRWPHAKIFSLTSGDAVMKMNTALGYVPVSFQQLTDDDAFWRGCAGCVNHDILEAKQRKFCICTGMLYDPDKHKGEPTPVEIFQEVMREMVKRELI